MKIAVPNETTDLEYRVALTPGEVKRLLEKYPDITVAVTAGAGAAASYPDADYAEAGAHVLSVQEAKKYQADITLRVTPLAQAKGFRSGELVIGFMDPAANGKGLQAFAQAEVNVLAVERIPRLSRAQGVDALSSQANFAGYRAVIEAASHYKSYFPVLMTSAGSSKPAKVLVLGVGVAGLQAIATARRLGAQVEAFDIRPDVKEQVNSLGARFLEFDLGEDGAGEGGYARELSVEAKARQQQLLQAHLAKVDIVITTAQIPGKPAPTLVTAEAVSSMKPGAVIVDLAAATGGNCPLTKANKIVKENGITIVGKTNYSSLMAHDASAFYARNLTNLLAFLLEQEGGITRLTYNLEDEIINGALVVFKGEVR
jgi:NAD(P) transhydrogenase subunit alpha